MAKHHREMAKSIKEMRGGMAAYDATCAASGCAYEHLRYLCNGEKAKYQARKKREKHQQRNMWREIVIKSGEKNNKIK